MFSQDMTLENVPKNKNCPVLWVDSIKRENSYFSIPVRAWRPFW